MAEPAAEKEIPQEISQWMQAVELPSNLEDEVKNVFGKEADLTGPISVFLTEYIFKGSTFYNIIKNKLDITATIPALLKKDVTTDFTKFIPINMSPTPPLVSIIPSPVPRIITSGNFNEYFLNNFISYYLYIIMWGVKGKQEFDLTGQGDDFSEPLAVINCIKQLLFKFKYLTGEKIPEFEFKEEMKKIQEDAFRVAFYNTVVNKYVKEGKLTPSEAYSVLFEIFPEKQSQRVTCFDYPLNVNSSCQRNFLYEAFIKHFKDITFYPFLPKSKDNNGPIFSAISSNNAGWLKEYDNNTLQVPIWAKSFDKSPSQYYPLFRYVPGGAAVQLQESDYPVLLTTKISGDQRYCDSVSFTPATSSSKARFLNAYPTTYFYDNRNYTYCYAAATQEEVEKYNEWVEAKKREAGALNKAIYFSKQYFGGNMTPLPQINAKKGDGALFDTSEEWDTTKLNPDWGRNMVDFYNKVLDYACDQFDKSGKTAKNYFALNPVQLGKKDVSAIKRNIKNVYPSTFANLKMPLTPFVQVELRTSFPVPTAEALAANNEVGTTDDDDRKCWEAIIFNPSCHFTSMEFEDNKGIKRVSLNIFDKNYTTIENLLAKAIVTMNLKTSTIKEHPSANELITYAIDKCVTSNLRIKFGYQTKNIYETDGEKGYKERVKDADKPIYQTPWQYFQILNFNQQVTDQGLNFTINGINSASNAFDQIKLLKKFAIIKGLPQNIIESFRINLNKSYRNSNASTTDNFSEQPTDDQAIIFLPFTKTTSYQDIVNDLINSEKKGTSMRPWHLDYIEIPIGDKQKYDKFGTEIKEYKTFREILDMLCSKVPPLYLDDNNNVRTISEGQEESPGVRMLYYTYSVLLGKSEKAKKENGKEDQLQVKFYYANPDDMFSPTEETKIRTYFWRNYGATVVKNMNISTETDFAQLNMPIFTASSDGGAPNVTMLLTNVTTTTDEGGKTLISEVNTDLAIKYNPDTTGVSYKGYVKGKDEPAAISNADIIGQAYTNRANTMMNNVFDLSDLSFCGRGMAIAPSQITSIGQLAKAYAYQFSKNMNSSIFRGTVELLGDPFYLFDENFEPYKYLIRLMVMRPDEKKVIYDEEDYENNPKSYSYTSGYYVITNIKHNIGNEGYTTILEVMKWPSILEIPLSPSGSPLDQTTS